MHAGKTYAAPFIMPGLGIKITNIKSGTMVLLASAQEVGRLC